MAQRNRKRGRRGKPRPAAPGTRSAAPKRGPTGSSPKPDTTGSSSPKRGPTESSPKRGTTESPGAPGHEPADSIGGWRVERPMTRSQRRDAQVRAGLTPIKAGERPGPIIAGAVIAGLVGIGQLIAYAAGLKIHGKSPAAGGTILLGLLLVVCAIGMWRLWYGAVLGFMALLAIVATLFSLLLIEASNLLGLLVAVVVVAGSGYLFFRLVRVLSRIQMPRYPGR